jgi:hypothetical protein
MFDPEERLDSSYLQKVLGDLVVMADFEYERGIIFVLEEIQEVVKHYIDLYMDPATTWQDGDNPVERYGWLMMTIGMVRAGELLLQQRRDSSDEELCATYKAVFNELAAQIKELIAKQKPKIIPKKAARQSGKAGSEVG